MASRVPEAGAGIDPGVGKADVEAAIGLVVRVERGGHGIGAGYVADVGARLVPGFAQRAASRSAPAASMSASVTAAPSAMASA
jgi:hypothetical protein